VAAAENLAHCLSSFLSVERGFISSQKGGGGAPLARLLIPLKEKRMTIRELRKSASETIISNRINLLSCLFLVGISLLRSTGI